MTPDEFRKEYVEPAVELWRVNQAVTHLAAHAIGQLDALVDVVWIAQGRPGSLRTFREDLGRREPAIAVVRDACDSHKHGSLHRPTAIHVSGERPAPVTRFGRFAGRFRAGSLPIRYAVLTIRKVDGSEQDVTSIIFDAMQAWRREFERLGYGTDWLVMGHQY